jgi:RHS repeat-associated protein
LRRTRVDNEFDEFGNKTSEIASTDGGRKTTTEVDYRNDESGWLIGLPTEQRVTGCAAGGQDCETRTTTDDYDDNGNTNLTVVEPNDPNLRLATVTTYGDFGTVASVTSTDNGGNSRSERYEYDADRLYATSTIDALEHETKVTMHSGLGVVLESTDPNGIKTTMRYDGFGRQVETNEADGSYEHLNNGAFLGFQQVITNTGGGGTTSVLMNALGHEIEHRARTFDGKTATVYVEYDERGRLSKRSRPTLPGGTPPVTTYAYDNRDRVTSITEPNGVVTRQEYVGLETHTVEPRGTKSYTVANVDGDVESRYEDDPGSSAWLRTRFEYGPFGLASKMVAADNTVQTMEYDTLGRLDRHVDPSSGTAETSYNAFGEPVRQINGLDEETTFAYDELGRLEQTRSPDGTATNTWDTADNGIGMLASATSEDGVVNRYTYDEFGHQDSAAWTIDGESYRLDYTYDEFGRQASLTYPEIPDAEGRLRIDYTYNASGYLQQIKNPDEPKPYWHAASRNATGALTEERLGNDVVSTFAYEGTTGRLTEVATTGPAGQLQNLSLGYDPNGNVAAKADQVSGRTEEFGYDSLNRLSSWSVSSAGGESHSVTYDYNTMGGMVAERVAGQPDRDITYRYGENDAPAHALTSRVGDGDSASYRYDAAGRQVSGPRRTIEFNGLDLPASISWGQPQRATTYVYDAAGERVRKSDDEQTVTYVGGVFEQRTSAGTGGKEIHNLHYIVAEGRAVAQINRIQAADGGPVTATKTWYLHVDNQASTMVVTNQAGRRVGGGGDFLSELFYDPFGRRIDAENTPRGPQRNGGVRLGFTSAEHEDENLLVNMNGRIYDAPAHRFLSPDPALQDPLNSQNHNRYSYVWNNPTTNTDPSGFQAMPGAVACTSQADFGPMADSACFGGSGMGTLDPMGVGGFFDNPMFNAGSTPGLDEDSTAVTMPDEVIIVPPVDVRCNEEGTCYGESRGQYWASYGWDRDSLVYLNRTQYLSGRHVFDGVERLKQDPVRYLMTFGATDPKQVLGVALMSAVYASDFIGAKGLASLGVKAAVRGVRWAAGRVAARRAATAEVAERVVSSSRWTRTSFRGNRVYQRDDLIDPSLVDKVGRTNLQRMEKGLAPIGPDGKAINLHHMLQEQAGPIAEVTASLHQQFYRALHINTNSIPSGIDRVAFGAWRSAYWMWRAAGF